MRKKIACGVFIFMILGNSTSYAAQKNWIHIVDNTQHWGLNKVCDSHNLIYIYIDGQGVSVTAIPKGC
jgi:hypothetical protein